MTANLYKVGDWVFCEVSPFQPYVIRKIEELTKTSCGNVEAKVICAYRYQDIPASVMASVEKYQAKNNENKPAASESQTNTSSGDSNTANATTGQSTNSNATENYYTEAEVADLNEQQRYNLRHRELFFSKCTDTIAATTIRAKCSVLLFNEEIEKYSEYLSKDDQFYYHLTYDPYQKSLVADKGEIRVGAKYQADVPVLRPIGTNGALVEDNLTTAEEKHANDRVLRSQRGQNQLVEIPISQQTDEILNWIPIGINKNCLTDSDIDKYLTIAKSIGTFARALDCNNAYKQPSLPLSAASASREITLFHAMNTLHENNYDIGKAVLSLITPSGPVLCRDELEEWSASEANLFEDALEKYGKEFAEIRKDYLPWKSMKSIIEYYYTWKTTDRYLQQKRIKQAEQESKLKQVYIPYHSKQNLSASIKASHLQMFGQYDVHLRNMCESCGVPNTSTNQWYAYSPTNLVQLIMTGNTNPNALAQAHAVALQNLIASGNSNQTTIIQQRLCADCWIYWKKFGSFKFANAKQERLNQLKNQVHKCVVLGCGREFKTKNLLAKHCHVAHGYFTKQNPPPGQQQGANSSRMPVRNRQAFQLITTPMTRAARHACPQVVRIKKLARRPFKLVDLGELNREWSKETRQIGDLLTARTAKRVDRLGKTKLDVKLIARIHRARAQSLKRKNGTNHDASANKRKELNGSATNGTNGHADDADMDGHDDEEDNLVIDYENPDERPEFLKYFENKCTTPCFTPERLAFPKPTPDQINKFHMNLINQTRKRPLDGTEGSGCQQQQASGNGSGRGGSQNGQSDSEGVPVSKRTLLANNQQGGTNKPTTGKQPLRIPPKSNRPTSAANLPNSPEDIFYKAVPSIKTLRREVEVVTIRRLARKPCKVLGEQHSKLYVTLEKQAKDSIAKYKVKTTATVPISETKLTNGDATANEKAGKEAADEEPMENETTESSTENGGIEKKTSNELNGNAEASTKANGGSVVVLD